MNNYKFIYFLILILAPTTHAEWAPENLAPFSVEKSYDESTIDKDGLATTTQELEQKVLNEQGRNQLVLQTVSIIPDAMTVDFIRASSITDGVESFVNKKDVMIRTATGPDGGVNHFKEMVIPFNNIKIGSITKYTIRIKEKKNRVKGLYSANYSFGIHSLEKNSKTKIRSVLPLYTKVRDPWKILTTKEYKDGKFYVFELEQTKPLFKYPMEANAILNENTSTLVDVSTMNNWSSFIAPIAAKYEKILNEKTLPPAFSKIVEKANKESTVTAKIDAVTSELSTIMTYSGDWTSYEKLYIPRSLSEIGRLKTGDCKDFALATTAMLRKLGITAAVSIVKRSAAGSGKSYTTVEPVSTELVTNSMFNHAIVKVTDGNKTLWVDPTNIVSNSSYIFSDIAGSYALEISKKSNSALEKIPYSSSGESKASFVKQITLNDDNTAQTTTEFELTGDYAKAVVQYSFMKNEETGQKVLMTYLRTNFQEAKSLYEGVNLKSRIGKTISGTQKSVGERLLSQEKGKTYLSVPLPATVMALGVVGSRRVTDVNLETMFEEKTSVRVKGYDFVGYNEGCTILTPWFTLTRKLFKEDEGFRVDEHLEFKKTALTAEDANSDKFQMAVGDVRDCNDLASIEVQKIPTGETLQTRLKDYTFEKAKAALDVSGPKSILNSRYALHIAEQLLQKEPENKNLLIAKARALRRVGYKNNLVDSTEYYDESDATLAILEKSQPQDPELLQQKTWSWLLRKDKKMMVTAFSKAWAGSAKNHDLYYLGGQVAEEMENYKASLGSYTKAYDLAETKFDKAHAAIGMAEMLLKNNEIEKALAYYKVGILANPDNTWATGHYMSVLSTYKKWDEAIATGEEMLKINPYGVGKTMLADVYAEKAYSVYHGTFTQQDVENADRPAEEIFSKGLIHSPYNKKCLLGMARIYYRKALNRKDVQAAQRVLSLIEKAKTNKEIDPLAYSHMIPRMDAIISGKPIDPSNRIPASTPTDKQSEK